ncbi:hypothetical protein ACQKII_16375 [Lysinibacillus sp. NPDC048646]|uniref:hypothetical protein n=1 Tax=Lysinibacillus sp. NPDC048646 TaxID=3390574 RepID=UPI003D013B11
MGYLLVFLGMFGVIVGLVLLVIGLIKKKKMKGGFVLGISIVAFIIGFIIVPTNSTESTNNSKDKEKVGTAAKPKEETPEDNTEKNMKNVATVTPDEFKQIEKGMSYDQVKKILGGKAKNEKKNQFDEKLVSLDFDGESGVDKDSSMTIIFNDGKVDIIMERGLITKKEEFTKEEKEKIEENISQIKSRVSTDEVEKIITDKLGKNNNMKKKVIEKIEATDSNLNITLNASENFTVDMTKRNMWMDSIKILEPLSKTNNIKQVNFNWQLPLVDKFGNEKDAEVMKFSIDKSTLDKINWDKFLTENFPDVVNNYKEHPALNQK